VQEVLLAAWQNLPNFRGEGGLRAWFLGIARHKVEDYYRKRIRETELPEQEESVADPAVAPLFDEALDSHAQEQKVQATLAALPEVYAVALLWRYRDNRSAREMAQLTGKTEKAIERLLARARESFRKRWSDVRR
jgi:RNA polymerase sigma-70 factor (ECF subfamily)